MFLKAQTDKERDKVIFPFVLHIASDDMNELCHITTIIQYLIFQSIKRIFDSGGQISGHKEAIIHMESILTADNGSNIVTFSICIRIFLHSIIRRTINILSREISCNKMAFIIGEIIPSQPSGIDIIICTFSDIRLMLRQIKIVTATAFFRYMVIFQR